MDGNPIGAGAGAAAGLQEVLLQRFKEAFANQQLQQEQQRIAIEQQRANNESEIRKATLASLNADRATKQNDALANIGFKINSTLPKGTDVANSPEAVSALSAAGMPTQHVDPTLGSRNITGAVDTASTAPKIIGLAVAPNPGHAARELTPGTDTQAEAERHRSFLQSFMNRPDLSPEAKLAIQYEMGTGKNAPDALLKGPDKPEQVYQTGPNGQLVLAGTVPKGSHIANAPNPPAPETFGVQSVTNPDGSQGYIRVGSKSGTVTPVTLPTGTTAGKPTAAAAGSADERKQALAGLSQLDQAINEAEPFIGPGQGRVSSAEQFIGFPDPKIQALGTKMLMAKMQVDHVLGGARAAASPQLLSRWDGLFSQKLTPEALHATVKAMKEMISAPASGAATSAPSSPNVIRYDMNGKPIGGS